MTSTSPTTSRRVSIGPFLFRNWRQWPRRIGRAWRQSLQFRTIVVTLTLSAAAFLGTGLYMSISIGNDLFQSRLGQVLGESERATAAAQTIFDSSATGQDSNIDSVLNSAKTAIMAGTSSRVIALYASPDPANQNTNFLPFASPELTGGVISTDLRAQVQSDPSARTQYWQSISLPNAQGGSDPAIVVGSPVSIPGAGAYELYIAYSLADSQQTLTFVQRTLWIAGLVLTLLIGAIAWVIVRLVVEPIRVAAETSQRLAAGQLEVRIPEHGEDVIATLARSFNGMADSLQLQIKELADLSAVQQRFVSDVSHELRTPLTTIRLAGDVLYEQRDEFDPHLGRTAELLHTQTQRFEAMLGDLLEISRFDAGSAHLDTEPTNLVRLAADVVDELRSLADSLDTRIELRAPGGHFDIDIDPRRIRRIIRNLVGNAIEHGEGKPVLVLVDSTGSAVALAVRDYGVGMTESDAERVFDRFWRADPSRQRTIGGTGLGLAISLEDATLHGGALEVWSEPGAGSCFRLTLPRVRYRTRGESPLPLPPADAGATEPGSFDESEIKPTPAGTGREQ